MSVIQMSVIQMFVSQMSVSQMSVSQMSVSQMHVSQMSVSLISVYQMSVGQISCQMPISQMSVSQMPVSQMCQSNVCQPNVCSQKTNLSLPIVCHTPLCLISDGRMFFDQKLCNHNFTNRMMIKQENDSQTKYIVQPISFLCPKTSFCKLDHIKHNENSRSLMKRSSLLKIVSKFAPKTYHRIGNGSVSNV